MSTILSWMLRLFGASAVFIGLAIYFFGPQATADFFIGVIQKFFEIADGDRWSVDADNEMRFYAVFWIAYGLVVFKAGNLQSAVAEYTPHLLALFFVGGVGRVLSIIKFGMPNTLFVALMVIELVLPLILFTLFVMDRRSERAK